MSLLFSSAGLLAQEFATSYQPHNIDEHIVVRDLTETSDNNIIAGFDIGALGMSPSAGIMKLDADGNVIWSNRLEIADSDAGCTFEVKENAAGNYYLWGLSKESVTGNMRAILTEMTPSGAILWSKEYDFGWSVDYAYTVNKLELLPSGDLQMMIAVYGKVIVMQTNSIGEIIWGNQSSIGPPDDGGKNPGFEWLAIPEDGGICASKAEDDLSLLRYDSDGELLWARRYDMGGYTHGKTIKHSPNGNLLVGGFISFFPMLMEISEEDGSVTWVKTFWGGDNMDFASMALLNIIGDDIIFDYSTSTFEHVILKLDVDGEVLETYKNKTTVEDYNKIEFTEDYAGYFYGSILADEEDHGMIFKSNNLLEVSCILEQMETNYNASSYLTDIIEVPFDPTQTDFTSQEDIAVTAIPEAMTSKDACGTFSGILSEINSEVNIFPNPAISNSITINVSKDLANANYQIVDLTGKVVANNRLNAEQSIIDISELSQGQYILAIQGENGLITKKITVIK